MVHTMCWIMNNSPVIITYCHNNMLYLEQTALSSSSPHGTLDLDPAGQKDGEFLRKLLHFTELQILANTKLI